MSVLDRQSRVSEPDGRAATSWKLTLGAILWEAAVVVGLVAVMDHESTPGRAGWSGDHWPASSRIPRAPDRPTLILFAHPRCPCLSASVAELARILSRVAGRVSVFVALRAPNTPQPGWEPSDLLERLATLPDVHLIQDPGGDEAVRFGAQTSGDVLLYGADERLLFRGGITPGRGHEGNNPGRNAIIGLISGGSSGLSEAPVFGCPLF
jgi:hypothetical protein